METEEFFIEDQKFILHKVRGFASREIFLGYIAFISSLWNKKIGNDSEEIFNLKQIDCRELDGKASESIAKKLFSYIFAVDEKGQEHPLNHETPINKYVKNAEHLIQLEIAILAYNFSFFLDEKKRNMIVGNLQKLLFQQKT